MTGVITHQGHGEIAKQWRRAQGDYLAKLRRDAGLTQAEIAKALGYAWPSVVGGHEMGVTNLPPERYVDFAKAVGVDVREFVINILRWQNPWAYAAIFGGEVPVEAAREPQRKGPHVKRSAGLPNRKTPRKPAKG